MDACCDVAASPSPIVRASVCAGVGGGGGKKSSRGLRHS